MKSDYAVGIYSTSVKVYTIVATLLGSIVAVTIPRLSMLMGQKRLDEYRKILTQVINLLTLFVIPGTIGIIMLSHEIIVLIAGIKYLPSVNSLRIIGVAIFFSNFSFIFYNCTLIPTKKEKQGLYNTLISAALNIILNILLIPLFSYDGTSFSTVIAEIMSMLLNYWTGREYLKEIVFSKKTIKNLISVLVSSVWIIFACFVCKNLISSLIVRLLSSVVLSSLGYFLILLVLKNEIVFSYFNSIKGKFMK